MGAAGDARKTDCAGHAVCDEGDPSMLAVAVRDDSSDCSCRHGMHGIKAAGVKRIVSAIEKAICVRAVARVLQGLLSAGDALEGKVECETIRECFGSKERGALRVGIFLYQAKGVDRSGNRGDECSGVHSAEHAIKTAEAVGCVEVRRSRRVGSNECGCDSHDRDGGKPMFGLGELSGKEPDIFLIGEKIRGECAEGDMAIRCSDGRRLRLLRGRGGGSGVRGLLRECGSCGGEN